MGKQEKIKFYINYNCYIDRRSPVRIREKEKIKFYINYDCHIDSDGPVRVKKRQSFPYA